MNTLNQIVVKADLFIVPNSLMVLNDQWNIDHNSRSIAELKQTQEELNLPSCNKWVQVWAANDDCQNFSCHPNILMQFWANYQSLNRYCFPDRLPINLFKDKKEGDIVVIETPEARIELRLNQSDYRYRNHGKFEEVLQVLMSKS